jgi:alpha-glucosidase
VETAARRAKYASPEGLGQAFSFDLLLADFNAAQFRNIITDNLERASLTGSTTTWVFSNHDVTRHATRYGLEPPNGVPGKPGVDWVKAGGPREVADIPAGRRQDPSYFRGAEYDGLGRDGCRVPLPWEPSGPSFGFGANGAHLPQPDWFAGYAASTQEHLTNSTLHFYRQALALRHELQGPETLEWSEGEGEGEDGQVLHFVCPGGWHVVANFGTAAVKLPDGEVLISSGGLQDGRPQENQPPGSGPDVATGGCKAAVDPGHPSGTYLSEENLDPK